MHGHQSYGGIVSQRGLGRRVVAVDPSTGRPRNLGADPLRGTDRSSI